MAGGTVKVLGLEGLEGKLNDTLAAGPVRRMMNRAGIAVRNTAVGLTPVDRNRLRPSETWEVDPAPLPHWVRVGTNVEYAPDIEQGTNAHYVDPAVLEPWAQRKGLGANMGRAVSRKIARDGTKAQPFLVPALVQNTGAIEGFIALCAQEIEAQKG